VYSLRGGCPGSPGHLSEVSLRKGTLTSLDLWIAVSAWFPTVCRGVAVSSKHHLRTARASGTRAYAGAASGKT
jgi:hypothetical protein